MRLNRRRANLVLMCLTMVIAFATAEKVPAQYTGPYTDSMGGGFNNPISAQMSTMLWNRIFYPKAYGNRSEKTAPPNAATPKPSSQPAPNQKQDESKLRFRSSGTRLRTRALADFFGNTAEEREQYLKIMNAVLDGFDQKVKGAGLENDVAIALSYFLAENARIYHGLPEISDQQFVEIRNAIAEAVLSTDGLNSITDRQKQEFYETLVAYTGVTQFVYEQAKQAGNEQMTQRSQQLAGQNLQTLTKMPPDSINFRGTTPAASNAQDETTGTNPTPPSNGPTDIGQLRQDYSENEVRADGIYKGKRFLFTGKVVEVSGAYYKTTGQDASGRYIYTNIGPNLKVTNSGGGSVIGWEVHCFFKDTQELGRLRSQERVAFEATVQGRESGTTLILVDAVLR